MTVNLAKFFPGLSRRPVLSSYERYAGKSWRMAAIVCTGVGACFTVWVLVYVLIKICDGTLGGHQTLGLLLLIGRYRTVP